jgi:hypothetical protein
MRSVSFALISFALVIPGSDPGVAGLDLFGNAEDPWVAGLEKQGRHCCTATKSKVNSAEVDGARTIWEVEAIRNL